ncbi:hypothetical protein MVES1_001475 [Malassezia vespertilionis]|uniref:uncharacterized protein n=1 Tax=Malassezia vespertilionis TaxID=2020962 RepID=UPI0024B24809|nr:uncharacterized protein MVES1_001475 [Malassezia vespertilionis]WFD06133.1 hypothetical protein MVES1_001475 [Malassezia vespertilionis]
MLTHIVAGYFTVEQCLLDNVPLLARNLHISERAALLMRNTIQREAAAKPVCFADMVYTMNTSEYVPGTPEQDEGTVRRGHQGSPIAMRGGVGELPRHPAMEPHANDMLSTGCGALDTHLGGGYAKGVVTELIGESSSGKSQLILFTAARTALGRSHEHGHGVALICTRGESAARHMVDRMVEMARAMLQDECKRRDDGEAAAKAHVEAGIDCMLRNVHIASAFTFDSAEHVLCYTLPGLVYRLRTECDGSAISLLVVDSVPPLLQDDLLEQKSVQQTTYRVRLQRLHSLAVWLRRLAVGDAQCPIAVVVINHVNDAFDLDIALARNAMAQGMLPVSADTRVELSATPADPSQVLPLAYSTQAANFSGLLASVPCTDASPFHVETDLKIAQLGLLWANCVNARYLVATAMRLDPQAAPLRRLRVVFSPTCTSNANEFYFGVGRDGIYTEAF